MCVLTWPPMRGGCEDTMVCRCRYLEVPTTAKPLYLHKSTSRGPEFKSLTWNKNKGPCSTLRYLQWQNRCIFTYNSFAIVGTSRYLQRQNRCIFTKVQVKVQSSNPWWGTRTRDLVVPQGTYNDKTVVSSQGVIRLSESIKTHLMPPPPRLQSKGHTFNSLIS